VSTAVFRLLGATLFESGDLDRAEAVLAEGSSAAATASASALQARIGVLLADIRNMQGRSNAETLGECKTATAMLVAEGDVTGLAEAWMLAGRTQFWLDDPAAAAEALGRAISYARQSSHHRAQMRASHWLAVTFRVLPIPADTAVARAEDLLQAASGDLWAEADLLKPLSILYAYIGRADDARAALARSRAIFARFGAKFALAESGIPAGVMEQALADAAAAVSAYHHCANLDEARWRQLMGEPEPPAPPPPPEPLHEWLLRWIADDSDLAGDLDTLPGLMYHLTDAWARRREPNVLLVHYESLCADLDGQMRWLADRLGITIRERTWPALVRAATFENMAARADQLIPAPGLFKNNAAFFRRAPPAPGCEILSNAELASYHARAAGMAPPDMLAWLHSPHPGAVTAMP
jgi:hypothetical protein